MDIRITFTPPSPLGPKILLVKEVRGFLQCGLLQAKLATEAGLIQMGDLFLAEKMVLALMPYAPDVQISSIDGVPMGSSAQIGLNPFVDRQRDPNQGLTHWEISDEELLQRVRDNFNRRRPGYRSGVILVSVPPQGFRAAIRHLQAGDSLKGSYEPRRAGETPRKTVFWEFRDHIGGELVDHKVEPPAVDVVLYHRSVLAEDGQDTPNDWDVITVLGKFCPEDVEVPMPPETLMANHFGDSGGSATGMSPHEFEKALKASYFYWCDKALLG